MTPVDLSNFLNAITSKFCAQNACEPRQFASAASLQALASGSYHPLIPRIDASGLSVILDVISMHAQSHVP